MLRVSRGQTEARGQLCQSILDNLAREADDLVLLIDRTSRCGEDLSALGVVDLQTCRLGQAERGIGDRRDLVV